MDLIINFIKKNQQDMENNLNLCFAIQSQTLWNFILKVAERMFLFHEKAIIYAEKIITIQVSSDLKEALKKISLDLHHNNININEQELFDIYFDIYNKSKSNEEFIKKNIFYI